MAGRVVDVVGLPPSSEGEWCGGDGGDRTCFFFAFFVGVVGAAAALSAEPDFLSWCDLATPDLALATRSLMVSSRLKERRASWLLRPSSSSPPTRTPRVLR